MTTFHHTASDSHNEDSFYIPVDNMFDIRSLHVEEGLVINTYDDDRSDFLGKCVIDESFLTHHREE